MQPAFQRTGFRKTMLGLATLALIATGIALPRPASATITITPMIVVIEGRQRFADVNLINTSDQRQTYELGWRFFRMEEGSGTYAVIDRSVTDFDLTDNLIFSPKRVTLEAHESQKIRLALRLKGEPPAPGDYRAHLEFTQSKDSAEKSGQTVENSTGKMHVGIGVNVAFSIPVIYRVGETDMSVTMGDISTRVDAKAHAIETIVPVTRNGGPFGLSGDLSIYHTPAGGKEVLVGQMKNANIFPEAKTRNFKVRLNTKTLGNGSLRIVLRDADKKKNTVYAERTVPVGP